MKFRLPRGKKDLYTFNEVLGHLDVYCFKLFTPMLNKEDIIIDLGAHIGFFSIALAPLVKTVFSIEADEENYRYLLENISKNKISNIVSIPKAIAKQDGVSFLYKSKFTPARHSLIRHPFLNGDGLISETQKVPTLSLSSLFKKIDTCKLLKSDIKGEEYEIFLNCPIKILKKIKIFLIEYHQISKKYNKKVLGDFFTKIGFEVIFGKEITYSDSKNGSKMATGSMCILNPYFKDPK